MHFGLGLSLASATRLIIATVLGIAWANNLAGSTDTNQIVTTLHTPSGVTTVPSNALAFGASPSETGVLRFPAQSSSVKRRAADGLSDLSALSLDALNALTVGDAAGGVLSLRGSRVALAIAGTERASVGADGLTLPGMTNGRVVTTGAGGLLVDAATVPLANIAGLTNAQVDAAAAIAGTKVTPNFGAQAVTTTGAASVASLTVTSLGAGIAHYSAGGAVSSSPVVNADVDAAAAIAGTKVTPSFGAQNIVTTGSVSAGTILSLTGTTGGLTHAARTTDAAGAPLVITSSAPWASATGTNRSPGNLTFVVPAAAAGGAEGQVDFSVGGTTRASVIQAAVSIGGYSSPGGIRLPFGSYLAARNADDTANFNLISINDISGVTVGTQLYAMTVQSSSNIVMQVGGVTRLTLSATFTEVAGRSLNYAKALVSPTFAHSPQTTDVAATSFTITSQGPWASATGTNRNPGNLVLTVPAAATGGTEGQIDFQVAGVSQARALSGGFAIGATSASTGALRLPSSGGVVFRNVANSADIIAIGINSGNELLLGTATGNGKIILNASSACDMQTAGVVRFQAAGTYVASFVSLFAFTEGVASPVFNQTARGSNAATNNLTIGSQAPFPTATGTNRNPGNLVFNVPAAVAGGTEGKISMTIAGAETFAVEAGAVNYIGHTVTTTATAGAASALPATPEGYITKKVAGVTRKFPFYAV